MAQTTQLTIFDQGAGLPAHLADLGDAPNVVGRSTVDQLSFRGKTWRVIVDGAEEVVKNAEGDPVPSINVVILDYTKKRARAYYSGGYEEGKTAPPHCWSLNGDVPDANVPAAAKQCSACASCPQAAKGAKITDSGKAVAACGQFKKAVIVPAAQLDFAPLLIKIPQTSMWDKDNKENENLGFYAFDQFMDWIKSKGVDHTARVVVKMKFDARTSYPKLLFKAHAWTPAEAVGPLKLQLAKKELIAKMLAGADFVAPPEAPAPDEFESSAPAAAAAAVVQGQNAVAKAAVSAAAAPAAAPAAKAPPKGRPAAKAAPAPAAEDDDAPVLVKPAAKAAPVVVESTATVIPDAAEAPAAPGLAGLLSGWDD